MQEVLDAMFERKVSPGESVIEQGDDGDNFYVIERSVCAWGRSKVFLGHFCVPDENFLKNVYHSTLTQNYKFDLFGPGGLG